MQIAVITVPREPMYLYETLDQLLASLPAEMCVPTPVGRLRTVDVFIGTPHRDGDEIAERVFARVRPRRIPDDLWALIEPLPPKLRAVGNFVAALRSGDGDLMLFEDDIEIKPGWIDHLAKVERACLPEMRGNTLVSLYSHRDLRHPPPTPYPWREPNCVFLGWPIVDFYGTLGLFVPAKHRHPLAEAAMVHLRPTNPWPPHMRWPFDEIVKMYVNDDRERYLAVTIPSFVDHRGDVSIINPTHGVRRAPMFDPGQAAIRRSDGWIDDKLQPTVPFKPRRGV